MSDVSSILAALDQKGVKLSLHDDQLHYRAPRGALTPADVAILRGLKGEILEFLRRSAREPTGRPLLTPRAASGFVPFAWNQQWWLSVTEPQGAVGRLPISEIRICAEAIRLKGKLDIECLHRSLTELIRRHEALRTEIRTAGGERGMEVCAPRTCALEIVDLSALEAAAVEPEAKRLVDEAIYDLPGPNFMARLLRLAPDHHVLVIAMSHLFADRTSISILVRELLALYSQAWQGRPFALPELPIQFADYVDWQYRSTSWWDAHHGPYWDGRLRGAIAAQFQGDATAPRTPRFRFIQIQTVFEESLAAGLREVSRVAATTLPMVVLAAYTAVLMKWRQQGDLVIKFVVHGRDRPELNNLVGFCSETVHLRIRLRDTDSFLDLVRAVTAEYYAALDHFDFGRVGSRLTAADSPLALGAAVNWVTLPQLRGASLRPEPQRAHEGLALERFYFTSYWPYINGRHFNYDPALKPYEPWLVAGESPDGVFGSLVYRSDRFEPASIERLFRNFRLFVETFVRQPEARVSPMRYEP